MSLPNTKTDRLTQIKQILDSGIIDHLGGEITSMTIARGDDPGTTITSEYQYTDADRAEIRSAVMGLYDTIMNPKDTNYGSIQSDTPDEVPSYEDNPEPRRRKRLLLAHLNWKIKHRRRKRYLMCYFKNANWNKDTSGNKRHRPYMIPDYMEK